ncbi:MAG: hypothetical protein ACQEP8_00635 [Chlamydiota bacterium]
MTRVGKQEERRHRSPRKRKAPSMKTGPKKDNLPKGFKERENSLEGDIAKNIFISKFK